MPELEKTLHCSFCGKNHQEVKKLIAGTTSFICDECVELCHTILSADKLKSFHDLRSGEFPSPRQIKEFLDLYVIGQDDAKITVSVAVYNHYKRLANPVIDDVEIDKSNVLLMGPSGVGKTFIAQTIARLIDVPFAIADATSLTEAGYVGDDVETIITRLLHQTNYDVKKAESGIIFLDEIEKKRKSSDNTSITRDVSGEGVQQALLKIIEGSEVLVPPQGGRKNPSHEMIKVNTKNILFFAAGAFIGLEKIIEQSINKDSGIGFGQTLMNREDRPTADLLRQVEPEHLIKYGLIPELVGRLPVIAVLADLDEDQLVSVLTIPKNAIVKQFIKMFKMEGVDLEFTEGALRHVARIAKDRKTGARGLRSVLEARLIKLQYQLPDLRLRGAVKVIIDETVILDNNQPQIEYERETKLAAEA